MTEKFTGIVIDVRNHTDRNNIVTLYTRRRGRLSFLSPSGSGKTGALRRSRLMPLAVIEGDFNFRANADLQKLGSFSPSRVWSDIYFNPVKQSIVLFLSEFLNRLLRASMADENLWDYISGSLAFLDGMKENVADFHIVFLASLLPFSGIQPDVTHYRDGSRLDLRTGTFTTGWATHPDMLTPEESKVAALLCRINYSNMGALRLDGPARNAILDKMLRYYGIHFPGCSGLRSLQVLHDVYEG